MNTNSHYKNFAGNSRINTNEPKSVIQLNSSPVDILPTHIKVNSPSLKITPSCDYTYNIRQTLNTELHELPTNPSTISFCIYRVITCKNRAKPVYPFLQYLLYKYPSSKTDNSNLMVFPYIKYKKGSIIAIANRISKELTGEKLSIKGFLENNDQLYLFFDLLERENKPIDSVNYKGNDSSLWWTLMDEICNSRKVINFPIHHSVYMTFFRNPSLIYVKSGNNRVPIPKVGYYGIYYKFIPIVAAIGSQNSLRGQLSKSDLFYFSTFRKAIRYAAWSPLYQERIAYNKKVTDIDGRYDKGGIVRFAIFMDKPFVPIDSPYEVIGKYLQKDKSWEKDYSSMYIGSIDYDGEKLDILPEYILTDTNQYVSLSYHMVDMDSVPATWKPSYTGYRIL